MDEAGITAGAINRPPVRPVPVWKQDFFLMDGLCTKISPIAFEIVHISTIVPISGGTAPAWPYAFI